MSWKCNVIFRRTYIFDIHLTYTFLYTFKKKDVCGYRCKTYNEKMAKLKL